MAEARLLSLVEALKALPGVGAKSAQRMAFHLLQHDRDAALRLATALETAVHDIRHCARCHTFTEHALCDVCADESRDAAQLCVVETPADQSALERTGSYRGLYFVLMGRLSPLDGVGVRDIGVEPLLERVGREPVSEVILATSFTAEVGEDNDPVAAKSGAYYALKVNGVTPAKLKPLDEVRADALAAWTAEEKSKALAVKAVALAAQAQKDGNLAAIAKELKVTVQQSPALSRNTNDTTFSADLITKLFEAAPNAIVQAPQGTGGNYIIARVTGIAHPPINTKEPGYARGADQLSQTVAGDFTVAMANAARARQGVQVNQKLVDSTIGSGGY